MRATRSGQSALLLLDVLEILAQSNVTYAVIGALAASVYGAVRASMDADVLLSASLPKAREFLQVLVAAGYKTELRNGDVDDPIPALLKVTDSFGNRVDFLIGLRGLDIHAFERLNAVMFQGQELQFIGLEDFIAMKAFAGGPLDLADATRAIVGAGGSLDLDLVRRLAKGFGREASESLEHILQP